MTKPRQSTGRLLDVIDFSDVRPGTLVQRSEHYFVSRCITDPNHPEHRQLGVVVDVARFEEGEGRRACYPVVHWEGCVRSSMTHPVLVRLYREEQQAAARWTKVDP